uniref:Uncharacterized protein n=1 Tax=Arundo donax TaxID=35708 RepID=A0A0A9F7U4_ARUDO
MYFSSRSVLITSLGFRVQA